MATKPALSEPLIFVPAQGRPQLLFVLLHGEGAGTEQMLPLAAAINHEFPLSMVVLPRGLPDAVRQLPDLIRQVLRLQRAYDLSGHQNALYGISQRHLLPYGERPTHPEL